MPVFGFKERKTPELLSRNHGLLVSMLRREAGEPGADRVPAGSMLFRNDSGEAAPPRAIMRITGVDDVAGRDGFVIDKPDGTEGIFVVNSRHEVANGEIGNCSRDLIGIVAASGSLANGTRLCISGWEVASSGGSLELEGTSLGPIDADFCMAHLEVPMTAVFLTGGGGIGARVDANTPTGASCTRYRFDGTDFVATSPSQTATVYNMSSAAVSGTTYIQAKRINGKWFVDMEPCPP